ncbi:MAG TPA: hypothetical protein VFF41_06615 [Gallionella sp.]|nr:hypothetical protein [Gallionella sp.]
MPTTRIKSIAWFALLTLLMATTRSHHFDSITHLPDASLAVFLLAGMALPFAAFPALLLVAGLVDYFAINYGGTSGWCASPAYWFLIPTYAVMWYAGRFYRARHHQSWHGLALFSATAFVATNVAFVISNGSFYLFSGRFAEVTALQYTVSMAQYYLPYLISVFLYLSAAAALQILMVGLLSRRSAHI